MPMHKTTLILPGEAAVAPFQRAVEDHCLGAAAFEFEGGPRWTLEFYTDGLPNRAALAPRLALAAAEAGVAEPDPIVETLPEIDWVAENQKSFQPVEAGRFFVHQEFHAGAIPPGRVPLIVNAGTAFGTGTHATTWGCLKMIDGLLKRGLRARSALDLGCGTAILAMALARTHAADRIVASDIDPEATRVARENARLNGTPPPGLTIATAPGMRHPVIRAGAPYDVIVANILAKPLTVLSRDVSRALTPGGALILSGLLVTQEQMVLTAYRRQGLRLVSRERRDDWSTLLLTR
jgi:ribosomal protein L11 methyltransferase